MMGDILGNPIPPPPQPLHNGICPNCGGTIKEDVNGLWSCDKCEWKDNDAD